ncbi:MAG: NAD(P)/FAD-dependent oxidoreductase [Chthoniobacterales bacterium]
METYDICILGAGPAGLSCAYEHTQRGRKGLILDKHPIVGGLSRTECYKGFRFDVGPHRFFTKNDEVDRLWHEIGGDEIIRVSRLTRIVYKSHFFDYPLKPMQALFGLGIFTSLQAVISYFVARIRDRGKSADTFEDWVVKEFGRKLYTIFFKTYTEKVWGIPCSQIGAEWAAQRIKGLSLMEVIRNSFFGQNKKGKVKSLVDQFSYPKLGAGRVYERMRDIVVKKGFEVKTNEVVEEITYTEEGAYLIQTRTEDGTQKTYKANSLFSSIPLTEFVLKFKPHASAEVMEAARALYYRDHITVNLILDRTSPFPDNWLYIHSPEVKMARICEYGNFSKDMLANPENSAISVEYFCFAHDDIWLMKDTELIELARKEMDLTGLLKGAKILDGFVVREKDSYPAYYIGHREHFDRLKDFVSQYPRLWMIGRGGMYKYNNQDHAMLSGLLAARAYDGEKVDLWEVNSDEDYLEEKQLPGVSKATNPHSS